MTSDRFKELEQQARRTLGCKKTWITPEELDTLVKLAAMYLAFKGMDNPDEALRADNFIPHEPICPCRVSSSGRIYTQHTPACSAKRREERLDKTWEDLGNTLREMAEEEPGW